MNNLKSKFCNFSFFGCKKIVTYFIQNLVDSIPFMTIAYEKFISTELLLIKDVSITWKLRDYSKWFQNLRQR